MEEENKMTAREYLGQAYRLERKISSRLMPSAKTLRRRGRSRRSSTMLLTAMVREKRINRGEVRSMNWVEAPLRAEYTEYIGK